MKKPKNTTEEVQKDPLGFLMGAMLGGSSGAIEAQEARGQKELANSQSLPVRMSGARPILESWGFKFGEHDGKDLFIEVEMPPGWKIVPTDHSMWSHLVDEKGRERAAIFYKAAFYDRDAFLSLSSRFGVRKRYGSGTSALGVDVLDGKTVIHTVAFPPPIPEESTREQRLARYELEDELTKQATEWLKERYPDSANPASYWD